jgi:magnesium chelatase family protein
LAHHGILFLNELPEFNRSVLETLREPLESGEVHVSRAQYKIIYPACCQLVAAMNPCPCGHLTNSQQECVCLPAQIQRYQHKISQPLLDRIDLRLSVPMISFSQLTTKTNEIAQTSAQLRERICQARVRQLARQSVVNARLTAKQLTKVCHLAGAEQRLLDKAMQQLQLSMRGYHRLLRVARTIADMDGCEKILTPHLAEALTYRCRVKHAHR